MLRKGRGRHLWPLEGHQLDDMATDREKASLTFGLADHGISTSPSGSRAQLFNWAVSYPLSGDTWWHFKASLHTSVTTFLNQHKGVDSLTLADCAGAAQGVGPTEQGLGTTAFRDGSEDEDTLGWGPT